MIKCVNAYIQPAIEKLTPSLETKEKVYNFAQRVKNFIVENKGALFLAATSVGILTACSFTAFPLTPALTMIGYGILAGCLTQTLAKVLNVRRISDQTHEKLSLLMGCANLVAYCINPMFGAASVFYNFGVKGWFITTRHFCWL